MAVYERLFYALTHYPMVILLDEAEIIRRFMRVLILRIREVVFTIDQSESFL